MSLDTVIQEVDYSVFDHDSLVVLEAYAVRDLEFYTSLQKRLEELAKVPALAPHVPHNLSLIRESEVKLEMIRKALSTVH